MHQHCTVCQHLSLCQHISSPELPKCTFSPYCGCVQSLFISILSGAGVIKTTEDSKNLQNFLIACEMLQPRFSCCGHFHTQITKHQVRLNASSMQQMAFCPECLWWTLGQGLLWYWRHCLPIMSRHASLCTRSCDTSGNPSPPHYTPQGQ